MATKRAKQEKEAEVWVFGDWRNYFDNRVTLQLLGRGSELAQELGATLCAVVFGHQIDEYIWEYTCHGADKVYAIDDPVLADYRMETYVDLTERLARRRQPEIFLIGATSFGRELAARVAKRLGAGLCADCVDLRLDEEGRLIQTAPSFGGNLLAEIITPERRPQMASVRPGAFQELGHDDDRPGRVVRLSVPGDLPAERLRLVSSQRQPRQEERLEKARVVVCGGRGMGSKKKFKNLRELARWLGGEVGATRPAVFAKWAPEEALIGQAGKQIKPRLLLSFGVSGAIQHTAAINEAEFIIAVNKNPNATMMKMADVAIVGDANQVCLTMIRELKKRLRG